MYQNGLGYFERTGTLKGDHLRLRLRGSEVDDILKSLTVLGAGEQTTLGAVAALRPRGAVDSGDHELSLTLPPGATHELRVTYAAPTPVWRATYRVVLDDKADRALLQGWAIVANPSDEDWQDVKLTLATGAPLSFRVDLHTPAFVERPDATGHFLASAAKGVVGSEGAGSTAADLKDSDNDGIPDVLDKCPEEPETYNGFDDDDGCPDRGRVIVRNSELEILDKIYFRSNESEIKSMSKPILDAVAATLNGNQGITLMEVGGHAAANEREPLGIASQRASAVMSYLVGKGVARSRLHSHAHGATRPARTGGDEKANETNRRTEFTILERNGAGDTNPSAKHVVVARPTLGALEQSVAAAPATRVDVAGMSRFEIATPVSIPHGTSGMIAILNQRTIGEEIYLYRPDPAAPGSALHPFRAARIVGPAGIALEPGPVAIYARGTFVGDAIQGRLHAGETSFLPFALDSSTTIHVELGEARTPVRLVAIARGIATVEDRVAFSTKYEIRVGMGAPHRAFLRHEGHAGYEVKALPEGTQHTESSALIPVALQAGATTNLVVEEFRPTRREVMLLRAGDTELTAYVVGSTLAPALKKLLDEVIVLRTEMGKLETQEITIRKRVEDAAERQGQLRESLAAIAKNPRAESLRKELLARLTDAVRTGEELSQKLARVTTDLAEQRTRLEARISDLKLDP